MMTVASVFDSFGRFNKIRCKTVSYFTIGYPFLCFTVAADEYFIVIP